LDIEPLPALLDPTEAAASTVHLFTGLGNVAAEREFGSPVDDRVWRDAATVVEARYRQQLLSYTSMEPRAIRPVPSRAEG